VAWIFILISSVELLAFLGFTSLTSPTTSIGSSQGAVMKIAHILLLAKCLVIKYFLRIKYILRTIRRKIQTNPVHTGLGNEGSRICSDCSQ
jgi:hypothetical protein